MVDMSAVASGFGSLKAAIDIIKGVNATISQAAIGEVKVALQEHIWEAHRALSAAQEAQAAALKRIAELEEEIVRLKNWDADKQRYELADLRRGFYAYVVKAGMEDGEPLHGLCTNCYQHREKSILVSNGKMLVHEHAWLCPNCKFVYASQWSDFSSLIASVRGGEK